MPDGDPGVEIERLRSEDATLQESSALCRTQRLAMSSAVVAVRPSLSLTEKRELKQLIANLERTE